MDIVHVMQKSKVGSFKMIALQSLYTLQNTATKCQLYGQFTLSI